MAMQQPYSISQAIGLAKLIEAKIENSKPEPNRIRQPKLQLAIFTVLTFLIGYFKLFSFNPLPNSFSVAPMANLLFIAFVT